MEKEEKEIIWAFVTSIPLLLLAFLAPILAYKGFFIFPGEKVNIWFQRSGSITVLFSVWMEYNLSKANEHINLSGIITCDQKELSDKYKLSYKVVKYVGVLLAISGTIIWGYGDLLY